jgi:hypothetical protein
VLVAVPAASAKPTRAGAAIINVTAGKTSEFSFKLSTRAPSPGTRSPA